MKKININTENKVDIIGSSVIGILGIIAIITGIIGDNMNAILLGLMDLFVVAMFWKFKGEKDAIKFQAQMLAEYTRIKAKKYYAPEKITEKDNRDLMIINKLTDISLTDEQFKEIDENGLLKDNAIELITK